MPIYNGSTKEKDLYYGGAKIKEAYCGSTKVYSNKPLYYCYWNPGNQVTFYFYVQRELVTVGQTETTYYGGSVFTPVTESSELRPLGTTTVSYFINGGFVDTANTYMYRHEQGDLYT